MFGFTLKLRLSTLAVITKFVTGVRLTIGSELGAMLTTLF